jgi:hypothetical protein
MTIDHAGAGVADTIPDDILTTLLMLTVTVVYLYQE